MSDENMRAEFEGWIEDRIANNGPNHWLKRKPSEDLIDNGGPYQMIWVEAAWQGWQASRAELVIDLPKASRQVTWDDESMDVMWPCEVIEAIEAAGARVKP